MDIGVPYNLERLLFFACGDPAVVTLAHLNCLEHPCEYPVSTLVRTPVSTLVHTPASTAVRNP
jgi:hypothetical protein